MKLNSKVTGGLAWAGLVLILAVPSADMLSKPSAFQAEAAGAAGGEAAAGAVEPAKVAAVKAPIPATRPAFRATPAAPAAPAAGDDPVESYVASGKKLPAYISDSPAAAPAEQKVATAPAAPAATKPAAIKKITVPTAPQTAAVRSDGTLATTDKMTTASIETIRETPPPKPYPASLRPAAPVRSTVAGGPQPLIIEDDPLPRRDVASRSVEPFLPPPPQVIDDEELEEWDSGSLADYLERRGLISDSDQAVRTLEGEFDEDGFFLSEGPRSRARVIGRFRDDEDLF